MCETSSPLVSRRMMKARALQHDGRRTWWSVSLQPLCGFSRAKIVVLTLLDTIGTEERTKRTVTLFGRMKRIWMLKDQEKESALIEKSSRSMEDKCAKRNSDWNNQNSAKLGWSSGISTSEFASCFSTLVFRRGILKSSIIYVAVQLTALATTSLRCD